MVAHARTLHLIDTTGPGGAETVFTQLAAHQLTSEGSHTLAMIRGDGWVNRRLATLGVPTEIRDCKGSFNFGFLAALCRRVYAERIQLIHSHLLGSNVYASMAGLLTSTPVIATFHGSVDISEKERFAAVKLGLIRRAATVVAVSRELQQQVAHRMDLGSGVVRLIPNAIDCSHFANARAAKEATRRDAAGIRLGALGNIRPAKAYDIAIRCIALLRQRGLNVTLEVAGDPKEPLISTLRGLCSELGVTEAVHFVGFVESPADFLAGIDLFLLSSSSEGHPLALTQAMAAGLPIVATRCGVETIIDERMAWLADVNMPERLASAVESALSDPEGQHWRGAAAQHEAFARYDNAAMLDCYDNLYQELLGTTC